MSIGTRLREARKAKKLTQTEFAERCGVVLKTQSRFERDEFAPSGEYLLALETLGIDAGWVLTGKPSLAAAEQSLLRAFRAASPDMQAAVLRMLGAAPIAMAVQITGGEQGQVVAGNAEVGTATFNVGRGNVGKKRG